LQGDATDDIRVGEIARSGIDLGKTAKSRKETDPKV
jgi:hypothetical protein